MRFRVLRPRCGICGGVGPGGILYASGAGAEGGVAAVGRQHIRRGS